MPNGYPGYTTSMLPYAPGSYTVPSVSGPIYHNQNANSQAPMQQQQNSNGLLTIFVNSETEVTDYPVAAGLTVMLINFDQGKFWLKSRSTNGVPQPVREFKFNELAVSSQQNQNGFVSRSEFDELNGKLNKLIAELGGTKNE